MCIGGACSPQSWEIDKLGSCCRVVSLTDGADIIASIRRRGKLRVLCCIRETFIRIGYFVGHHRVRGIDPLDCLVQRSNPAGVVIRLQIVINDGLKHWIVGRAARLRGTLILGV